MNHSLSRFHLEIPFPTLCHNCAIYRNISRIVHKVSFLWEIETYSYPLRRVCVQFDSFVPSLFKGTDGTLCFGRAHNHLEAWNFDLTQVCPQTPELPAHGFLGEPPSRYVITKPKYFLVRIYHTLSVVIALSKYQKKL